MVTGDLLLAYGQIVPDKILFDRKILLPVDASRLDAAKTLFFDTGKIGIVFGQGHFKVFPLVRSRIVFGVEQYLTIWLGPGVVNNNRQVGIGLILNHFADLLPTIVPIGGPEIFIENKD